MPVELEDLDLLNTLSLNQLPDLDRQNYVEFLNLLLQFNSEHKLTTIVEPREMVIKHLVDCLLPLDLALAEGWLKASDRVCDLGSGGGLPGMVWALTVDFPQLVLLDSDQGKISFLDHVIKTLNLKSVSTLPVRAREVVHHQEQWRHAFDMVVLRAVGESGKMIREVKDLVAEEGRIMFLKGPQWQNEKAVLERECRKWQFKVMDVKEYVLPEKAGHRVAVMVKRG